MIVQRLKCDFEDAYKKAERYYSILSAINSLSLTQREIQLLAFTVVRGNMSYGNVKKEFCEKYNTTFPTISNIVSKLKRMKMIVKENGRIKVNPKISLNFNEDVTLMIKLLVNGNE
jgi:DNA-binding MarR family transcriptional regulator